MSLRRTANWIADHSIEDNGLGYCAADEDGLPCGRPAMAEGTNEAGDTVAVCSMHDGVVARRAGKNERRREARWLREDLGLDQSKRSRQRAERSKAAAAKSRKGRRR